MALALVAAGLLPLPALLSTDAPAAAGGLWGATTIAVGLTWAFADILRTTAAPPAASRARRRQGPATSRKGHRQAAPARSRMARSEPFPT
jgi:hypothetical protein